MWPVVASWTLVPFVWHVMSRRLPFALWPTMVAAESGLERTVIGVLPGVLTVMPVPVLAAAAVERFRRDLLDTEVFALGGVVPALVAALVADVVFGALVAASAMLCALSNAAMVATIRTAHLGVRALRGCWRLRVVMAFLLGSGAGSRTARAASGVVRVGSAASTQPGRHRPTWSPA